MRARTPLLALAALAALMLPSSARAIGIEDVVDGGNTYPWVRVELPGTVCSNGSQYRFWYYDSPTSNNMVISFEGGGACWDYPSCSGQTGILGAAHPERHPDRLHHPVRAEVRLADHQRRRPRAFRSSGRRPTWSPTAGTWCTCPYCTGDVHVGNRVVTYTDPTGVNPPIMFRHNGYNNSVAIAELPAHPVPEHQQAARDRLQRGRRREQRDLLQRAAHAASRPRRIC